MRRDPGGSGRLGEDQSEAVRSGGLWSWKTEDGRALLYAGRRRPTARTRRCCGAEGRWVERWWYGSKLDGQATFRQEFRGAGGPAGYWPSIVIVPEAGCWLLTVRIVGQTGAAGIVVTRVVSP